MCKSQTRIRGAVRLNSHSMSFSANLQVLLRCNPVATLNELRIFRDPQTTKAEEGFSFHIVRTELGIEIIAYKTNHGLTDGILDMTGVLFDANL